MCEKRLTLHGTELGGVEGRKRGVSEGRASEPAVRRQGWGTTLHGERTVLGLQRNFSKYSWGLVCGCDSGQSLRSPVSLQGP